MHIICICLINIKLIKKINKTSTSRDQEERRKKKTKPSNANFNKWPPINYII